MRLILVAVLCLAVGFGAGWAVFEQPWKTSHTQLDWMSVQRLSLKAVAAARDADCQEEHGPFYSCRVYTKANAGADYNIAVSRNGRCFHASLDETGEALGGEPDASGFSYDNSLPDRYRAWLKSPSDC